MLSVFIICLVISFGSNALKKVFIDFVYDLINYLFNDYFILLCNYEPLLCSIFSKDMGSTNGKAA